MRETVEIILDFYWRPMKAASRALDQGRLMVALVLAIALAAALAGPRVLAPVAAPQPAAVSAQGNEAEGVPAPVAVRTPERALENVNSPFTVLMCIGFIFVPATIGILTVWKGLGGFATILRRDYLPVVVCLLFAWVAAHLPVLAAQFAIRNPWLEAAGSAYWLVLVAGCSLSVVMGVGLAEALVSCAGGIAASAIGFVLYGYLGHSMLYLASPWFLYWGYGLVATDVRLIGSGLQSRQNFRRQLEFSTLNPRDSDAHYQLGLIYQARRQYDEAIARFKQALAIDPREAGAHYQLGRIALSQGRYQEALDSLCNAAEIDEKHSSNEVWRDIGVASFQLGHSADAVGALRRYVDRREYDPEGLYWLGKALAASDHREEAASSFTRAIEAAQTAPAHRRGVVRQWAGKARAELKSLG